MPFQLLPVPAGLGQDARFDESLIAMAAQDGPTACVWESAQGLVVPRTYQRFEPFAAACAEFAGLGWPVSVRQSGGGIVPQGPGIINLSLAYAARGKPLDHSDEAYLLICRVIAQALQEYGIVSQPQAVEGSFCDGRYNLAVGQGASARKIAGTAQLWRRHTLESGHDTVQMVLVHALILAAVDADALTACANRFEQAVGNHKRYGSDRIASLHELCNTPHHARAAFTLALKDSLQRQLVLG